MSKYILALEQVGRSFYTEVGLFCMGLDQQGKESSVYKEAFSQIMGSFSISNKDFAYNTLSLPQLVSLCYVEILPQHEPVIRRFTEAIRIAAIQTYDLVMSNPVIEKPNPACVYLMDTVTLDTLIFCIHVDASFV